MKKFFYILPLAGLFLLSNCSNLETEAKYPNRNDANQDGDIYADHESIFGQDGFWGAVMESEHKSGDPTNALTVNSFLWRASLETISFMPLNGAPDPFGGVIVTDWYNAPETPNERNKLNILITDKQLRAGGLKVSMFKQRRANEDASWKDVAVNPEDTRKIEDAILAKAREMKINRDIK